MESHTPHTCQYGFCSQRTLPPDAVVHRLPLDADQEDFPAVAWQAESRTRAGFQRSRLWPNRTVLRVRFLTGPRYGGSAAQIAFVKANMIKLSTYANVRFTFVLTGQSHIRIAFDTVDGGSWSYVGTDALSIPQNQPTMNFGWMPRRNQSIDDQGVVLHEAMHAVGAVHEHSLGGAGSIQWNRPVVIAALSGPPNNWDLPTIESNVFYVYPDNEILRSLFDSRSVMLYSFPSSWTLNGFQSSDNNVLSALDKATLRRAYPGLPVRP